MIVYLDSSVILRPLLDHPRHGEAMEQLERTIKRMRLSKSLILAPSRTMSTIVKTLDAFHLVTAVAVIENRSIELVFATHDESDISAGRSLQ